MNEDIKVFVKINENNCVIDCNSSIFLTDTTKWIQIDEGTGDKYAYAKSKYFDKSLIDENGIPRYKYLAETKTVEERTAEEIQADIDALNPQPTDEEKLQLAITEKLSQVAGACQSIIYAGSDITLSDATVEHFSYNAQDQINFTKLRIRASEDSTQLLPYHSDGNLCKMYSAADIITIVDTLDNFLTYHITYCNSLNMWIKSCLTIEEVEAISYGSEIPEQYQSETLKLLMSGQI